MNGFPMRDDPTAGPRMLEAADWLMRLREEASEQDIANWVRWCEADARNQQAFDRIERSWRAAGHIAPELKMAAPAEDRRSTSTRPPRRHRVPLLLAANLAVLSAAAASLFLLHDRSHPLADDDVVAASTGQQVHKAELSDGSQIELAARSVAAVHYTEAKRAIDLEKGEAYFTVAPNKQRPFVVAAGAIRVRAVGTAFNVRNVDNRVSITVTKGIVDVYRVDPGKDDVAVESGSARAQSHLVRVEAGGQVTWSLPSAQDPVVAAVNPATTLGWRVGKLSYYDEPLSSVVADFNRYSARQVQIDSEAVRNLRFSGTLHASNTAEWLAAVEQEFPVTVRRRGNVDVLEPAPGRHGEAAAH